MTDTCIALPIDTITAIYGNWLSIFFIQSEVGFDVMLDKLLRTEIRVCYVDRHTRDGIGYLVVFSEISFLEIFNFL